MTFVTEDVTEQQGYNLHVLQSKKFKTIHLTVKLKSPLNRENITERALLPFVLQQGTNKYPTSSLFRRALDDLFGATLSIDSAKKGNDHVMSFRMEIANQTYLSTEQNILEEALQFLSDVIYDSKTIKEAFDQTIVSREKQTLKQKINAVVDNKMSYANMRLIDKMCEGEAYSLHVHGYQEDLNRIDEKSLYTYYQQLLQEDQMDVYVLGDLENIDVNKLIPSYFNKKRNPKLVEIEHDQKEQSEPKEIIEEQAMQQGKLHLGYRTNITFRDDAYPALQIFNAIFGGFPSSKLFINVREKNSLAYYASSRFESHKGLLFVFSGIDPKDYAKAKGIIVEQMDAMVNGDFTEEQIEEAKKLVVNQWKETLDHPDGLVEILYHQVLAGAERSPDQFVKEINQVSKDNLLEVGQKIQLDTVYFLTAQGGNENA
ncbi:EF-P 5-aminopentanol modification-associated protein YfmF [Paraliobacillus sp. X-1268]|uniref:EF-P 5-aminopentanol modification-associated protein YfmF n=1 Tax=Paraliobacillus sp. X-1268 TaxID=2213193 RepID=UPI000E3C8EA3|nr:pitrilysin family protein [Paraliobacillus sp. X-1268]